MARIAGINIPLNKRVEVGLTYIYGIGPSLSRKVLAQAEVSPDTYVRDLTEDEVRRLRDAGTTIFLTTHYLEEADALCDRLAIIDHGRIVAEGTPDQLKREISGDVVTVGVGGKAEPALALLAAQDFVREASLDSGQVRLVVEQGEVATPAILRLLDRHGLELETISLHRPSLDDVFLRKTGRSLREAAA
jgi:ABC-2 type transport system ATP-binding protein